MKRDYDIQTGKDTPNANYLDNENKNNSGQPRAVEHVYFKNPDLTLKDQTIGFCVHNYSNNTDCVINGEPYNKFKLALINQHGYQLWPNLGNNTIKSRSDMFCTGSKSHSVEFEYVYREGNNNEGLDILTVDFATHVKNN